LLRDGDLLMNGDSSYQSVKLEDFDASTFHRSQGTHRHPQDLVHGSNRSGVNNILQVSSSLNQQHQPLTRPISSLDMFKFSIGTYLTPSGSTASDSSSKALTTSSGQSATDESSSRTSSQETEDSHPSVTAFTAAAIVAGNNRANDSSMTSQQETASSVFDSQQQHRQQLQMLQQLPPRPSTNNTGTSSSTSSTSSSSTPGIGSSSSAGSVDTIELPEDIAIRRAEQNRAAQRAFRQRKQKYIKWLESKAEELDEVYRIMALVRAENQQLCNLVMELDEKFNGSKRVGGGGGVISNGNASNPGTVAGVAVMTAGGVDSTGSIALTGENLDSHNGLKTSKSIHGIDESLGREISMRLMNLATFPVLGSNGDRETTKMGKVVHQPRSPAHSKAKGRMAFKMSQQSKQQEALLQAALKPSS
ncbi:hypothetical protein BGZ58_005187, partial [Dissophora ornata]